MINLLGHSITVFGLMCVFSLSQAATLENITYSILSGERVRLQIQLSEPLAEQPLSFTIDNPARIVLDFPNTTIGAVSKNQPINVGIAQNVSVVEATGRARVVLNLIESVPYDIEMEGNTVIVMLGSGVGQISSPTGTVYQSSSGSMLEAIDFRRGDDGEGRIIVTLSDPSINVNMNQISGNIVLDFIGAELPDALNRKLDVVDFATSVKEIDTSSSNSGTRMQISTINDNYEHLAYQSDNIFIIEVRTLDEQEKEARKEQVGFTGERLSLNFQSIEVRAVLQLIADFTELNMVASDTVSGNVTLRLKNVPWDQALDIILKSKGLGMRKIDNTIMVAPNAEIAAREKLELEASQQVVELAPLRTEFMQINYAKADELVTLIKAEENNLLTDRGSVTLDARTNILIVQDVSKSLQSVRELILKLDIPIKQVLIESRIVNADESFAKDLGVRFGYSKNTVTGAANDKLRAIGGGKEGTTTFAPRPTSFHVDDVENLIVNLPVLAAESAALNLAVGRIGSWLLQLELSALIAEGRGEDIANPKVITVNQREAIIEEGVEIPYQEASSSGATTVSFKKAVLSLKVTPQITPDNKVLLDLQVNQDTQGDIVGGIPTINTRSVGTKVMVDNGETVVLGGVYTQSKNDSVNRIPFFSNLPYVGFLFRRSHRESTKRELLIFVTPKILGEDLKI